jgi:hypothetical protein
MGYHPWRPRFVLIVAIGLFVGIGAASRAVCSDLSWSVGFVVASRALARTVCQFGVGFVAVIAAAITSQTHRAKVPLGLLSPALA